jgi:hypothetical protein
MSKPHEHTNKLERGRKTAISENVIIDFIGLEKGIFLKPFKALQTAIDLKDFQQSYSS